MGNCICAVSSMCSAYQVSCKSMDEVLSCSGLTDNTKASGI